MKQTIRVRLTLLYTSLFLVTSGILVTVVNLSLGKKLESRVSDIDAAPPPGAVPPHLAPLPHPPAGRAARSVLELPDEVVEYQWIVTAIAIIVLSLLSVAAGWWLAGRMLRPLRGITATARRLSLSNLHERIGATGPHDELRHLADTFDAMLARLERSVESQRLFIANAAHELRTPLATQRAAIQIGLEDPVDLPAIRETLLTHNRRTERLIDSLLVLAQAEHGLDVTQPVALDVLATQAVAEVADSGLTVTVEAEPVTVAGDPVLLTQLLANLVQNAVRYNIPDGSVYIGLTSTGVLTVRNTGPVVPEERVEELFEPFRQLQSRTGGGAGLGLSIVAAIARVHRATLSARANPGGGLELTVRWNLLDGRSVSDPALSFR
ncbi:signal transduction histidine kinase [Kibdelosporangium banguiense]|uniref:histidine kinase n=1 Tax=Kibdelosporangium banguiense TaxID=1365924 RepID=A0ABS4T7E1_9PSEU|nr:ATP-binding protein [Kibdelosporangium banguiense]MBP2320324.1 signal transduction histidine kinase [Kibdelosporangium banguiense]